MNPLGQNIKHLRKRDKYSQIELATIIGVSQTSVAHYEAGTRQPTIETLMELSQLFNEPIDLLVGNEFNTESVNNSNISKDDLVDSLLHALLQKKEAVFMNIMEEEVYPSFNLTEIVEDILTKVMYQIGSLWEQGSITVADEHYATNIIRKVNGYLSIKNSKSLKRDKAILFTVGAEKHTLGLEMVDMSLEQLGIDTLYLGNNIPMRSLDKVVNEYNPSYIFISITMSDSVNTLEHIIEYIKDNFNNEIIIGVGGQGIDHRMSLPNKENMHILKSVKELTDIVNKPR